MMVVVMTMTTTMVIMIMVMSMIKSHALDHDPDDCDDDHHDGDPYADAGDQDDHSDSEGDICDWSFLCLLQLFQFVFLHIPLF